MSQCLADAGRSISTSKGHTREVNRLKRFASKFGYNPIANIEDVRLFLNSDSSVTAYLSFLASQGLAYRTARKILFCLRGATAIADSPDPKKFSRFVTAALLGYRALFIPKPPRPIVSIQGFRAVANASLSDILLQPISFLAAVFGPDPCVVNIARWRAAMLIGFKACLPRPSRPLRTVRRYIHLQPPAADGERLHAHPATLGRRGRCPPPARHPVDHGHVLKM